MAEADEALGELQGRFVHKRRAFVAPTQAAKALEPSEGAFNKPAAKAQIAAMKLAVLGQKGDDTPIPEMLAMRLTVMGTIRQYRLGIAAGIAKFARNQKHPVATSGSSWVGPRRLAAVAWATKGKLLSSVSGWSLLPLLRRSIGTLPVSSPLCKPCNVVESASAQL